MFVIPIVSLYRDYHFMEIGKPIRNCYCTLKTQTAICYKKINTVMIQVSSLTMFLALYSYRNCDRHGSDSSALKFPTSINHHNVLNIYLALFQYFQRSIGHTG